MAWLSKRGNIYYLYWRSNGRQYGQRLTTDRQAALEYKSEFERAQFSGDLSLPNRTKTWQEYKKEYLDYSAADKSPRTLKIDRNALTKFTEIISPGTLFGITTPNIEHYKQIRLKEKAKPVTVNIELRALKAALSKAVQSKYIRENPAKTVKYLTVGTKIRFLSQKEAQKLLNACDNRLKPVILTFLYTGFRLGELLNLSWQDMDFSNKEIRVHANGTWIPKNNKERIVPLHPKLLKTLKPLAKKEGPVFRTLSGKRLDQTTLEEKFRSAVKRAKIEHCRLHDLRHTFASHLARRGCDIYRISKLLGHSSVKTTEIYAHLVKSDLAKSVSLLSF